MSLPDGFPGSFDGCEPNRSQGNAITEMGVAAQRKNVGKLFVALIGAVLASPPPRQARGTNLVKARGSCRLCRKTLGRQEPLL